MNVKGLERSHIASHLQKHRLRKEKKQDSLNKPLLQFLNSKVKFLSSFSNNFEVNLNPQTLVGSNSLAYYPSSGVTSYPMFNIAHVNHCLSQLGFSAEEKGGSINGDLVDEGDGTHDFGYYMQMLSGEGSRDGGLMDNGRVEAACFESLLNMNEKQIVEAVVLQAAEAPATMNNGDTQGGFFNSESLGSGILERDSLSFSGDGMQEMS